MASDSMPSFHDLFKALVHTLLTVLGYDDLRVLLVLFQHRNQKTGLAYPSVETIARLTFGIHSKSRVRRSLKRLEAQGLIRRCYAGGGRENRARWEITLPIVSPVDVVDGDEKTGAHSGLNGGTYGIETGAHDGVNGGTYDHKTGATVAPQTLKSTPKGTLKSNRSTERCDFDFSPSGFDFDSELELAQDKDKADSPFNQLIELGMTGPAAAKAYTYQSLGRTLAQAILDRFNEKLNGSMFDDDHSGEKATGYLGNLCWHPKAELVSAARRLRVATKKPRRRILTDEDDAPFQTRSERAKATAGKVDRVRPEDDEIADEHAD